MTNIHTRKGVKPYVQSPPSCINNKIRLFENRDSVRFITVKGVAEMLCVSPRTVRDWVYKRTIPFIKINGALRFNEAELKRWLGDNNHDDNKIKQPHKGHSL